MYAPDEVVADDVVAATSVRQSCRPFPRRLALTMSRRGTAVDAPVAAESRGDSSAGHLPLNEATGAYRSGQKEEVGGNPNFDDRDDTDEGSNDYQEQRSGI